MTDNFQICPNPFCEACKEKDCLISNDGTCEMIRIYLKAKKEKINEEKT